MAFLIILVSDHLITFKFHTYYQLSFGVHWTLQCAVALSISFSFTNAYDSGEVVTVLAETKEFNHYIHGLQDQTGLNPVSAEVQPVSVYPTKQEATPISHNRRKRYMSFRPLFVYRLQAIEARQKEDHREAKRLHSTDFIMENNYDYWILPTHTVIWFNLHVTNFTITNKLQITNKYWK